ncbi:hypothetical protein F2Q70_00006262 [Brassica cretica]|uniref:Uncharacterized protein n=1 Tax=Brassica cretica TaxID=69181 RepID=A0A8S9ITZ9_BRACR|nr:hypothetical protein F2Q70_00006262 [Brassica cretica]
MSGYLLSKSFKPPSVIHFLVYKAPTCWLSVPLWSLLHLLCRVGGLWSLLHRLRLTVTWVSFEALGRRPDASVDACLKPLLKDE